MVLNHELAGLKRIFEKKDYSTTLTLIVAQKRHKTRLFLEDMGHEGRITSKISSGTVVDTIIIQSHGAIGTSKPTHYHVLSDDNQFSLNDLQKFIYYLCFTCALCTKTVSIVTPVYYADLVAYRARMYYQAFKAYTSSSPSSWSPSLMKVHVNLENSMVFI
ncbi:unnamed protein product [Rhodiola kirilowii]